MRRIVSWLRPLAMRERHTQTEEEREYYSLNSRVYAILAPFYDAVTLPLQRLRCEVARVVDLGPASKVLDVATGTGAQAFAFAEKARQVVGIDLSEAMLRIARKKNRLPNVMFLRADAADLPFDDTSFDASCASFALHEMPSSIRERVLREMARVTRAGGSVIAVDYALPRNRFASSLIYHIVKLYEGEQYASFARSDLGTLLRKAGIEVLGNLPVIFGLARIMTGRRARSSEVPPEAVGNLAARL